MKILVLTDSDANPRPFPVEDRSDLEDTFPYLLRTRFPTSTFYQLSYGNVTTEELVGQAIGYLSHWKPDYIIVLSGFSDCRTEAFSIRETVLINLIKTFRSLKWLYRKITDPRFVAETIAKRRKYRVLPEEFEATLKKFKSVFHSGKFIWLEIFCGDAYEEKRPGTLKRVEEYNSILKRVFGDSVLPVQDHLRAGSGIARDHEHLNVQGHRLLADLIGGRIEGA